MLIVKTRKEGTSVVLSLPHAFCRDLAIVPGDYLVVRVDHDGHIILGLLEEYIATIQANGTRPSRRNPRATEPQPP